MADERSELGVALEDPSAHQLTVYELNEGSNSPPGSDTIGDIREKVPSLELDKVLEDSSLEKLTMQLRHTVNLERTDNSKESHSDVFWATLLDDRHSLNTGSIVRPSLSNLAKEFEIDLVNDLQVSREEFLE